VRFGALSAATIKIGVILNVTTCSLVEFYRHFGGSWVNVYQITRYHVPEDSKDRRRSTLKIQAAYYSEASAQMYQTTRNLPEEDK
jgi:hypothetical protein